MHEHDPHRYLHVCLTSAVTVSALLVVSFVFGFGGQLVNVAVMAVRQAVTPDGMQGRAAATITFVGMGLTPLGSLVGGFLAEEWGLRTSLLVTAAGMMLSPAVMALSPLARLGRELPSCGRRTSSPRRSISAPGDSNRPDVPTPSALVGEVVTGARRGDDVGGRCRHR
jgi:MFS family permease